MKPHKWAKEIKAWADGAEIEFRSIHDKEKWILDGDEPAWNDDYFEFRIKPQPKEPKYLYVYESVDGKNWITTRPKDYQAHFLVGKIKLETEE